MKKNSSTYLYKIKNNNYTRRQGDTIIDTKLVRTSFTIKTLQ